MKYNIGDKFWRVNKQFNRNTGAAKKIKMVDADGVEWYRYDKDVVEFDLKHVEIVGRFHVVIEGHSIWNDEEYTNRYCIRVGEKHEDAWEEELDGHPDYRSCTTTYWHNKEDAEAHIKEQRDLYR